MKTHQRSLHKYTRDETLVRGFIGHIIGETIYFTPAFYGPLAVSRGPLPPHIRTGDYVEILVRNPGPRCAMHFDPENIRRIVSPSTRASAIMRGRRRATKPASTRL